MKAEAEAQRSCAHAALNDKTEREHARNYFGFLPQGYCEQKTLFLEETTTSVLSVLLLIYSETRNNEYIERIHQMSYSSLSDNGMLQIFSCLIK